MEKIDCILLLKFGAPFLFRIKHKGIYYTIEKQGFSYSTKQGKSNFYIFGVACRNTFFKVKIDMNTLNCYLLDKAIID